MKRMLINATQPEEIRVALVDGKELYNLDIESVHHTRNKSNIYKARVVHIERSLEAAFVDYGADRHGFLPLKEIAYSLFKNKPAADQIGRIDIQDAIYEGQEIIVQVEKEERHNKGAALTTIISLAGRYMVLIPNDSGHVGISRKIAGADRAEAREMMSQLKIADGATLIFRTAGIGESKEELQLDVDFLTNLWAAIEKASSERPAPFLIYQESEVIIRAIRDYLSIEIEEILIDDKTIYQQGLEFMEKVMPHNLHKLHLYHDHNPLFTKYQIEKQIESAFSRDIQLPSGGVLIIDHTEALTSIDINSARATKGHDIEETALNTNLEAAVEIAKQLRLRDLGGLIVIDFIDMANRNSQREVEQRTKSSVRLDRAKVQVGDISRFGLLEMSRQRLRPSLEDSKHLPCPRCDGQGHIRDVESISLAILRIIEEEAMKDSTSRVIVYLPVSAATFLLNEKRQPINELQQRLDVEIVVIPLATMQTPQYKVQRIRLSEITNSQHQKVSYAMMNEAIHDENTVSHSRVYRTVAEQPAVKPMMPDRPINSKKISERKTGLVAAVMQWFANILSKDNDNTKSEQPAPKHNNNSRRRNRNVTQRTTARRHNQSNSSRHINKRTNRNNPNKSNSTLEGSEAKTQGAEKKVNLSDASSRHKGGHGNDSSRRGRRRNPQIKAQPPQGAQPQGEQPQEQPANNKNNLFQNDIFPTEPLADDQLVAQTNPEKIK